MSDRPVGVLLEDMLERMVVQGTVPEAPGASTRLHNPLKFRRPDSSRSRRGHHL